MAEAAAPSAQVSMLVSDVPENALDALASGPTMPDTSTTSLLLCHRREIPPAAAITCRRAPLVRAPPIAGNSQGRDAVFTRSRYLHHSFERHRIESGDRECRPCGIRRRSRQYLRRLGLCRCCRSSAVAFAGFCAGCFARLPISGGEVTVRAGKDPGTGGRNQQFALYCAENIEGQSITVLSAGTDGIDGNSHAPPGPLPMEAPCLARGKKDGCSSGAEEAGCISAVRRDWRRDRHRPNRKQCARCKGAAGVLSFLAMVVKCP